MTEQVVIHPSWFGGRDGALAALGELARGHAKRLKMTAMRVTWRETAPDTRVATITYG